MLCNTPKGKCSSSVSNMMHTPKKGTLIDHLRILPITISQAIPIIWNQLNMLQKYWSLFSSLPSKDIQLCFNPSKNRGEFFFKRENFGGKSIDITVLCRNGFSPRTRQGYQQSLASLLQILGVLAIVIRQEKRENCKI